VTAIGNDYGAEEVFARQVRAHGRPGDILVCFSTSGASANVLVAAATARDCGIETWALTGPAPNPLAEACDDALCASSPHTATVQELHLVSLHMVCAAFDRTLAGAAARRPPRAARGALVGSARAIA
jgi:D-sedoheptulose 7-phosphate isomerase